MELRHLRYFIAVAEELSFTRAASRLHIAQPALSVQIRNLETEVGARLLVRKARGIALTQAGEVFLQHARQSVNCAAQSVKQARRAVDGEVGTLAIGYTIVAEFLVFPNVVPPFRKAWPDVQFTFHSLSAREQIEGLRRDELDLGFLYLPVPTDEFDVHELQKTALVAVLPEDHPLAAKPSVSLKEISKEPLIGNPRLWEPEMEQLLLRVGGTPRVAYEYQTIVSILNFVAVNEGCSILPDYVRRIHVDGVAYRPIRSPNLVKTLAVIKKKTTHRLAQSFYRHVVEQYDAANNRIAVSYSPRTRARRK